jgi:hypothetical protein
MIIFGWKVRLAKRGGGTFQCPVCNAPRAYEHIAARNWFTLFFIPLIPLRNKGEFVRCSLCQVTLDPVVLQTRAIEQATFGPPVAVAPTPGSPLPPPSAN